MDFKDFRWIKVDDQCKLDLKMWKTWYIVTPPLSHHCYYWDVCIERHDHHWQWLGTWIGRRNFKWFMWFIFSLNIEYLTIFITHLVTICLRSTSNLSVIEAVDVFSLVLLYFFMVTWFVLWCINLGYMIFLWSLVSKGLTSNQYLTKSYKSMDSNPFDLGWRRNFWKLLTCKSK